MKQNFIQHTHIHYLQQYIYTFPSPAHSKLECTPLPILMDPSMHAGPPFAYFDVLIRQVLIRFWDNKVKE